MQYENEEILLNKIKERNYKGTYNDRGSIIPARSSPINSNVFDVLILISGYQYVNGLAIVHDKTNIQRIDISGEPKDEDDWKKYLNTYHHLSFCYELGFRGIFYFKRNDTESVTAFTLDHNDAEIATFIR